MPDNLNDSGKFPRPVLIIDDDADHRTILTDALTDGGFAVDHASSGKEAFRKNFFTYSAVILDYNLTDMTGIEILKRIQAGNPNIPVIIVTGENSEDIAVNALNLGAADYICKAGDYIRTLSLMVKKNIERYRLRRENQKLQEKLLEQNKFLQELADHDFLTSLYNHRVIHRKLEEEINRCRRSTVKFCCAIADIDHFKKVNDSYGHVVGDYILRSVAQLIKGFLRNYDTVGRYGGEEFLILLPNANLAHGTEVLERIRKEIANTTHIYSDFKLNVTVSFGVAEFDPAAGIAKESLISHADKALYEAKNSGRNKVVAWRQ